MLSPRIEPTEHPRQDQSGPWHGIVSPNQQIFPKSPFLLSSLSGFHKRKTGI